MYPWGPGIITKGWKLGLVLAGLRPVWVRPELDAVTGLPGAVPVAAVEAALAAHPGACGVVLGDPSYTGTRSDIAAHGGSAGAAMELTFAPWWRRAAVSVWETAWVIVRRAASLARFACSTSGPG